MAEGGGLLNRYTLVKAYRGFESLRLRQVSGSPYIRTLDSVARGDPAQRGASRDDGPSWAGAFGFESLRLRQVSGSPYIRTLDSVARGDPAQRGVSRDNDPGWAGAFGFESLWSPVSLRSPCELRLGKQQCLSKRSERTLPCRSASAQGRAGSLFSPRSPPAFFLIRQPRRPVFAAIRRRIGGRGRNADSAIRENNGHRSVRGLISVRVSGDPGRLRPPFS